MAIKVLSNASDENSRVKFLQEAAIMSQFRHPNVIKLYGVVTDADQVGFSAYHTRKVRCNAV